MADEKLQSSSSISIDLSEFIDTSDDEILRKIQQGLQLNTLKSLDIPHHFMRLLSAKTSQTTSIMTALETNTSVISLDLAGNYINYGIIEAIARLLDKGSSLKYLNFSQSIVSDDQGYGYTPIKGGGLILRKPGGFIPILHALAQNTSLKYLNLAVKGLIFRPALKALVAALKSNKSLMYLDFSVCGGYADPHGKNHLLLQSMETNNTLQYLNLTKTCYHPNAPEFANRIAKLLETNQTLKGLNLSNNDLNNAQIAVIIEALKENYSILVLDVSENNYSSPKFDSTIVKLLDRNLELFQKQQQKRRDILANYLLGIIQLPQVLNLLICGYLFSDYSKNDLCFKDIWSNPKEVVEWPTTLSSDMERKTRQHTLPYQYKKILDDAVPKNQASMLGRCGFLSKPTIIKKPVLDSKHHSESAVVLQALLQGFPSCFEENNKIIFALDDLDTSPEQALRIKLTIANRLTALFQEQGLHQATADIHADTGFLLIENITLERFQEMVRELSQISMPPTSRSFF